MALKLSLHIDSEPMIGLVSDAVTTFLEPEGTFQGPYDLIPTLGGFDVETEGLLMTEDVTVEPIPIAQATNPAGGYTFVIG